MISPPMERKLRLSGLLIVTGLGVEAGSLLWSHVTAFVLFLLLGGLLLATGLLTYLYAILPTSQKGQG